MSHFTVLVIGDNPEKQLAPFDENKRGNKNSKWDWYLLGGRWTGFFKMKEGVYGKVGEPGVMTDTANKGYADQAYKGDIDFKGMKKETEEAISKRYESVLCGDHTAAGIWESKEDYQLPKDKYIKKHSGALTHAVIKNGEWYERGEMCWFALVANEKDAEQWNKEYEKLINELPDNTLLSLYDCHI